MAHRLGTPQLKSGCRRAGYRVLARDSFLEPFAFGRCLPPSSDGPAPAFRASDFAFALEDFACFGMSSSNARSGAKFAHQQ
jgi:hypothetical protein